MVKKNMNKFLIGIVLISMTFGSYGFACQSTGNSQVDTKLRTLARTEDDIAAGLESTAKIIKQAKDIGALSEEDVAVIKPLLKTVGESNLQAIEITKSINILGELPLDKLEQLLSIINFASDQLVQLNNEGVLRIKDKTKKLLFNTIVVTLQSSVTSLVPLLTKGK